MAALWQRYGARLALPQEPDAVQRQAPLCQCGGQVARRVVEGLLRQHERAPVHADGLPGLHIQHELHGVFGVHVHGLHEVAGQVGADGQGQKVHRPQALANGLEVFAVARVAREQKAPGRRRLRDAGQSPRFVVPLGLADWFTQRGMGPVTALNWWEHTAIAPGLRVVFTPSQHWSRRTPWDTNASLWGGYLLEWARPQTAAPWRFLFPGDTGYSEDFKAIRQRLGPVDFLALPIGAYLPRDFMKPMHVNPEDAVQLMLDVEARQAMGVHWGTFMLTQEAFDHPPRDLAAALAQRGLPLDRVWLLRQGETRAIPLS